MLITVEQLSGTFSTQTFIPRFRNWNSLFLQNAMCESVSFYRIFSVYVMVYLWAWILMPIYKCMPVGQAIDNLKNHPQEC